MHTQNTKEGTNFYKTGPKFTIFLEKLTKTRQKSRIFRATLAKCYSFANLSWRKKKFAIFSLKYGQKAMQIGGREADGRRGAWRPPPPLASPPGSATDSECLPAEHEMLFGQFIFVMIRMTHYFLCFFFRWRRFWCESGQRRSGQRRSG